MKKTSVVCAGLLLQLVNGLLNPLLRVAYRNVMKPLQISTISIEKSNAVKSLQLSGLQGKALLSFQLPHPSYAEVKASIPLSCFQKDSKLSALFALQDMLGPAILTIIAVKYLIPILGIHWSPVSIVAWTLYALLTGTWAVGMWVTAHECGHGAFSNNKLFQTCVGYIYQSLLLVPYFTWQRSHSVHHAFTNHITDGETHVPPTGEGASSRRRALVKFFGRKCGNIAFGVSELIIHLVLGWPAYLLFGASGGPSRGVTNHFVPFSFSKDIPESKKLFTTKHAEKMWLSDIGIVAVLFALAKLAKLYGMATLLVLYLLPLLVVNMWLVGYTWLQHTDTDVPHLSPDAFSFTRGAFLTIDRPYKDLLWGLIDHLHHSIGSTHVAHHIDPSIPHYHATAATEAIRTRFPSQYLYDNTPVFRALWRVAGACYRAHPEPLRGVLSLIPVGLAGSENGVAVRSEGRGAAASDGCDGNTMKKCDDEVIYVFKTED